MKKLARGVAAKPHWLYGLTLIIGLCANTISLAQPLLTDRLGNMQLVRIELHSPADRQRLAALNLDLTEHGGTGFIEAMIYSPQQLQALTNAGLRYTVRIPDVAKRDLENRRADAAFAKANTVSALPSGRTGYRHLEDYEADLRQLATEHPDLARLLVLNHKTLEGRDVLGIEISERVTATDDGKPVFLEMGVHHAREWPSGETSMEFAIDLVKSFEAGDARIRNLLKNVRVIVVPVVNPDGFNVSRVAGDLLDLSGTPASTAVYIAFADLVFPTAPLSPGGAYHRKNCRVQDGQFTEAGSCLSAVGRAHIGVDNNRNYGFNWGPGLNNDSAGDSNPVGELYAGPAPFSEPETQNIRELISSRHITTLVTTHTFGGLILRAPSVASAGLTDDDAALVDLGDRMARESGDVSKTVTELYDVRGGAEDWSYHVTGGYGFTYELGTTEFHPAFSQTIDLYRGFGAYQGRGIRGSYLVAAEAAADRQHHAVLEGEAAPGTVLRLSKRFDSATLDGTPIPEVLQAIMTVPASGRFSWHINPSTSPMVLPHYTESLGAEISRREVVVDPLPPPTEVVDLEFEVAEQGPPALKISLTTEATASDAIGAYYQFELLFKDDNGKLNRRGLSSYVEGPVNSQSTFELVVPRPQAGRYLLRASNTLSTATKFTVTFTEHELDRVQVSGSEVQESYVFNCEKPDGTVLQTLPIAIKRGEEKMLMLTNCGKALVTAPATPIPPSTPAPMPVPLTPVPTISPASPQPVAFATSPSGGRFGGSASPLWLCVMLVSAYAAHRRRGLWKPGLGLGPTT